MITSFNHFIAESNSKPLVTVVYTGKDENGEDSYSANMPYNRVMYSFKVTCNNENDISVEVGT